MTNIVILDSREHAGLQIYTRPSARLGDAQRFVQVVVREFPLLAAHYPIMVSKDSETGAFFCGAMMGFDEGENLFLKEGEQDGYRPLQLQRGPFYAAGDRIAVDLDSPRLTRGGGEPLFEDDGRPTAYLDSITSTLRELQVGYEMTRLFLNTLVEHRLLTPIEVRLSFDDGDSRELIDLYGIDQERLRELPDDVVLQLFRRGYLQLIYIMTTSVKQIASLANRKNSRLTESDAPFQPAWS